jgi:twitching motility protein PilI
MSKRTPRASKPQAKAKHAAAPVAELRVEDSATVPENDVVVTDSPVVDVSIPGGISGAPRATVFHAPASPQLPPFEILDDYEQRSLAHVVGLPEQLDAPGLWRGVGYRIGDKRLASGFDEVVEIMSMPQVTPVPGSQPWLLGVANIRGNLLPIVDLKQFLEGERTVLHESQRVLIVRQPGGDVAVTIDELFGQRSFNESQQQTAETLAESPLAQGRYTHFIDRAYRLADDSWGIFSLERLSRTPEFRQAAA